MSFLSRLAVLTSFTMKTAVVLLSLLMMSVVFVGARRKKNCCNGKQVLEFRSEKWFNICRLNFCGFNFLGIS